MRCVGPQAPLRQSPYRKGERISGFAGARGIVNMSPPRAHPCPIVKIGFDHGTRSGRHAQGWRLPVAWALSVSLTRAKAVFVLKSWCLGTLNSENGGKCTYLGCACSPLTSDAYSVDSYVCFHHFTARERSRHFQGLTHLTCFRNMPHDETNGIPEGLFCLLHLWRQFRWSGQMQVPALVTVGTHPGPMWSVVTAILVN